MFDIFLHFSNVLEIITTVALSQVEAASEVASSSAASDLSGHL